MKKKILILGAGPAGLTLAVQLLKEYHDLCDVTLIEQQPYVGGLSASFEESGIIFDYGSHRLHPAICEHILSEIDSYLGNDLLKRERNGRIYLQKKYVRFPLNPFDLCKRLPVSFMANFAKDVVFKLIPHKSRAQLSFADVLLNGLGKTLCESFYFPYAVKLWGIAPDRIAAVQAKRRVAAGSVSKIIRKAFGCVAGSNRKQGSFFYYPKKGFGQICSALADQARQMGGVIHLSSRVKSIHSPNGQSYKVSVTSGAKPDTFFADFIFSTIPVTSLICSLQNVPEKVVMAGRSIHYRNMVLCYFILDTDRFTRYDAHYFPETDIVFSRVSEPKNYSCSSIPKHRTGICVEIPCSPGDTIWNASDEELKKRVLDDLKRVGLAFPCPPVAFFSKHLSHAYPVYDLDYKHHYDLIDRYLSGFKTLVSLGRQGLFVHDNTHHTMETAYCAVNCLSEKMVFDHTKWNACRDEFEKHVVVD